MTQLETKAMQLLDRKNKLEEEIQELKDLVLEENTSNPLKAIAGLAQEIGQLETQLELTELALKSTQDKLRARQEYEASKEYADKQKMQEKLLKQAQKQAGMTFEKLLELQSSIQETRELVQQADKIHYEISENKNTASYYFQEKAQPFSWLWSVSRKLQVEIAEMELLKQRGVVE
jgi:hypothetical protein